VSRSIDSSLKLIGLREIQDRIKELENELHRLVSAVRLAIDQRIVRQTAMRGLAIQSGCDNSELEAAVENLEASCRVVYDAEEDLVDWLGNDEPHLLVARAIVEVPLDFREAVVRHIPDPDYGLCGDPAELWRLRNLHDRLREIHAWDLDRNLIADRHFETHVGELCEDLYGPDLESGPLVIDWQATTRAVLMDYRQVEFDGATYWIL